MSNPPPRADHWPSPITQRKRSFRSEILDPAAFAGALEVLARAFPAAPFGEPDPLEVEDLDHEEGHDPGDQLGAGEDVHRSNVPSETPGRNGPVGLFSAAHPA